MLVSGLGAAPSVNFEEQATLVQMVVCGGQEDRMGRIEEEGRQLGGVGRGIVRIT